ncbi:hypothetical protein OIE67_07310 [Nonomuraea fuscirosea]|uniref:hypothetical protein n=1 Tax=Nonomuraea fuscirosea TaxID=1291556 RepID=UPI002DDC4F32|nr:hypothetical protein [Nonomuraea fuscirosea]WSA54422.1 hypothetical protein OIE67_07310 [Nonomuraea fuscirosea]
MIAVVISLVAVVLAVLAVVALGMRSMNRRESSLPPERLKEMAEKEENTLTRSTDQFAAHEPRMANFSPDFSPIDEPKPKPVRTGQRGRRGVDEWGNPSTDDDDEEFWANIRSDAEEGGFGAGGTVAARKGASRPVERERPAAERPAQRERPAERERTAERERPAERERTAPRERPAERRSERPAKRSSRSAKPQPATAGADPNAATVQAPLPQRQPAAANLADLVEPQKRAAPSQSELADQRTVTFAAPTADVMSILGAGAQPVPAPTRPESSPVSRPARAERPAARPAPVASNGVSSNAYPASGGSGSFPAQPSVSGSGSFPAVSNPASPVSNPVNPASSGSFPAVPAAPIHGAPTSDPFPAYGGADALETTYPPAAASSSGSWPASPDIFDDPAPAAAAYPGASSWPAFEQPAERSSYPASYEVRAGWAVADDSDPLTAPSPATGTPTAPARAVSNYDDVLSAPKPPQSPFGPGAYETGDITTAPAAAWPDPPAAGNGAQGTWPGYTGQPPAQDNGRGNHRRGPEQDYPNDYYR